MATTCKLIAKTTLGSGANTIDFQSIPATYTDLLLVASLRADYNTAGHYAVGSFTFNNSGGTAYSNRRLLGDGESALSFNDSSAASVPIVLNGSSATASTFATFSLYVPNYAGSTNKSASGELASESNTSTAGNVLIGAYAYLWANTAAIDRITLKAGSGNFTADSSAQLFGITKA